VPTGEILSKERDLIALWRKSNEARARARAFARARVRVRVRWRAWTLDRSTGQQVLLPHFARQQQARGLNSTAQARPVPPPGAPPRLVSPPHSPPKPTGAIPEANRKHLEAGCDSASPGRGAPSAAEGPGPLAQTIKREQEDAAARRDEAHTPMLTGFPAPGELAALLPAAELEPFGEAASGASAQPAALPAASGAAVGDGAGADEMARRREAAMIGPKSDRPPGEIPPASGVRGPTRARAAGCARRAVR
jgi:hypothetical protein